MNPSYAETSEREAKQAIWMGQSFVGRCSHGAALCSLVLSPDSTCVNSIDAANLPLPFIILVVKTRAVDLGTPVACKHTFGRASDVARETRYHERPTRILYVYP